MHASFPVGRIAGIKVGAHWSLVVVVWLIAWSLADGQLPAAAPGHSRLAYWIVGAVTAVAFFGCLLAHELSHSVVARRRGIQVDGIVLWLFGGVSQLHSDAPTAEIELRVAVAGPAMSVAIAAVCLVIAAALDTVVHRSLLVAAVAWLGWINGLLAAFNLVPAFPLDGGRVLRAWLWRRRGDKEQATLVAARAGRIFGYVLVALGALELFAGGPVGGLWLVFLGWFLLAASTAEASQTLVEGRLATVTVDQVMSRHPVVVPADVTVERFVDDWLDRFHCSTFPLVSEDGSVVGLMSLARAKRVVPWRRASTPVAEVACPRDEVPTCEVGDRLVPVITAMNASADRRALVFERGTLVGIVSPSDVTRTLDVARLRADQRTP